MAQACARSVTACASHMLVRGEEKSELSGAWQRMDSPMRAIPMANGRSSSEESESGASLLNRSKKAFDLGFKIRGGV